MSDLWIVITSIVAVALLYVLLPLVAETFRRFRGTKSLKCPIAGEEVNIDLDARRAALTSALGRVLLRVKNCSLWPERKDCAQDCVHLPEIERRG